MFVSKTSDWRARGTTFRGRITSRVAPHPSRGEGRAHGHDANRRSPSATTLNQFRRARANRAPVQMPPKRLRTSCGLVGSRDSDS